VRLILAVVLAGAALSKLSTPGRAAAAMGTFGFATPLLRWGAFGLVTAAELILAAGVALGSDEAAYAAAALMALFALTLMSALMQGKTGAPCACFGSSSKVSGLAVARTGLLAAAFVVTPSLPASLDTDGWLTLGLIVALAACVALAVAVLALAREVGMLRLRLGPASALEIAHEGPEVGGRIGLIERFSPGSRAEFALAVFSSESCRVCRALEPAVDTLRSEPSLAVKVFSEGSDADVWEGLEIPGAPYAVALERDGTVGAKGTFNNLAQLESIVAAAERRRSERARVEALGV
jgi:hypothetical protein